MRIFIRLTTYLLPFLRISKSIRPAADLVLHVPGRTGEHQQVAPGCPAVADWA